MAYQSPDKTWPCRNQPMKNHKLRLATFRQGGRRIPDSSEMAAAGLFLAPTRREPFRASCYSCSFARSVWVQDDNPVDFHLQHLVNSSELCEWGAQRARRSDNQPLRSQCRRCHVFFPSRTQFWKHWNVDVCQGGLKRNEEVEGRG